MLDWDQAPMTGAQTLSTMFLSSGDLIADRRFAWARDCAQKGDLHAAAELLAQALELTPGYASAWFALGEVREKLGDRGGAIDAFRHARAADPEDGHGAVLNLIRLGASPAVEMPPAYVRALFDHYASDFDRALLQGLNYRAPALLRAAVERVSRAAPSFASMLDLGCGTGLAGAEFRPIVKNLVGVDLSAGMAAQAERRGVYDRLEVNDIAQFLKSEVAAGRTYALIVAADVFAYLADLRPVIEASAAVLAPAGLLAFTAETHAVAGGGVVLGESLRYAHAAEDVQAALASAGLSARSFEVTSTRSEKGVPVPGLLVVAARAWRK
jgi:predicted TPR repeat methyltransferase